MGKDDERAPGAPRERHIFAGLATLREPAAPRVRPPPEAREATDALLHHLFEEFPEEPDSARLRAAPSREEDWPPELHSLPLKEE